MVSRRDHLQTTWNREIANLEAFRGELLEKRVRFSLEGEKCDGDGDNNLLTHSIFINDRVMVILMSDFFQPDLDFVQDPIPNKRLASTLFLFSLSIYGSKLLKESK